MKRRLASEKFFASQKEYEKENLPEFTANAQNQSIIIEKIIK